MFSYLLINMGEELFLFTFSLDFRIGRHFFSKIVFVWPTVVVLISLEKWIIFFADQK